MGDLDLDRWLAENVMGYTHIRGYTNWKTEHFHPTTFLKQAVMCEDRIEEMELEQEYSNALETILTEYYSYKPSTSQIAHASPLHRCQAIRKAVEG